MVEKKKTIHDNVKLEKQMDLEKKKAEDEIQKKKKEEIIK